MNRRNFDGYGNNLNNPDWGRALSPLFRHPGLAAYTADGHAPSGQDRPNPRDISNDVCAQIGDGTVNADGISDYLWVWGQFLDHELDLTDSADPAEELDIPIKPGDPALPDGGKIPFRRSRYNPSTGGHAQNPREQINLVSSYIDGSNIYGENPERVSVLRSHVDGKLKSSGGGRLLPKNEFYLPNEHGPSRPDVTPPDFFAAGDIRCNEHVVLTCMHTLWMREHNRLCDELIGFRRQPALDDSGLFNEARRRVIATVQAITFEEFLPALLGTAAIPPYDGYKPIVNASISNMFSTACYRLGHSMVSPVIQRIPPGGAPTFIPLPLEQAFWNPGLIDNTPQIVDEILNGLAHQPMQQLDTRTVDALRNLLFKDQIAGQAEVLLDLPALNIQRGRDHGLPTYNQCRIALGLAPKRDVREITCDGLTQRRLLMAYRNIELIDPWIGGLAESHVAGAQVGELFFHVIRDQFTRVRNGDRFWYEAPDGGFDADEIAEFQATRLADIITRNTAIQDIQDDVFRIPEKA